MRVDALTLRAVAGELNQTLVGSRIDAVIAPTPQAVALQCYGVGQNRWLLLSAHSQLARLHLLPGKPQKLVSEPSTFVMLLRKYIESGRIAAVRAVPWERIVEIDVRGHEGNVTIIVEAMGNLANIILVNDQRMILGALHQFGHSVNRFRTMQPGQMYVPPPTQMRTANGEALPRLVAASVSGADLAGSLAPDADPIPAWRVVMTQLAGMSQEPAQDVVGRAVGDPLAVLGADDPAWERVATELHALATRAEQDAWEPVVILDAEGQISDGALWPPYIPTKGALRPMPTVNTLLAEYFVAREWRDALGGSGADLRRTLKTAQDRLQKKHKALQAELDALLAADTLRHEAEMLLAFATEIPEQAKTYTVPDLGDGQGATVITLDPRLTAVENANTRFNRYHKMRRAALQIPEQISRTEVDLARVAQLQTDLDLADTLAEIAHVRAEITEARFSRMDREEKPMKKKKTPGKGNPKGKQAKARVGGEPLRFTSADGFTMWAGKNSQQNEHVTFDLATGNDLWFHARGVPGAHVIVKCGGRPVSPATIQEAADVAAWYSGSRTSGSVAVDYTEQKYVRHMKDGGPGMVIYVKEKTIPATPREVPSGSRITPV